MIVVDMDGVLVDFCASAYAAHGRTCAVNEPNEFDFFKQWGLTADEFWEPIDAIGSDFWRDIPIFTWTHELLSLLADRAAVDGVDLIVATTPSRHAQSTAGKVEAIKKLFGPKFRNYCITPRKWILGGPGAVLIDDLKENCDKFEANGGRSFLFPQPWNEACGVEDRLKALRDWI